MNFSCLNSVCEAKVRLCKSPANSGKKNLRDSQVVLSHTVKEMTGWPSSLAQDTAPF